MLMNYTLVDVDCFMKVKMQPSLVYIVEYGFLQQLISICFNPDYFPSPDYTTLNSPKGLD